MVVLQGVHFLKAGVSELPEILIPLFVKVLHLVLADRVVFCHLLVLDAFSQFILVFANF
jgi:hypothetical protein